MFVKVLKGIELIISNSVNPEEIVQYVSIHLGPLCLPRTHSQVSHVQMINQNRFIKRIFQECSCIIE